MVYIYNYIWVQMVVMALLDDGGYSIYKVLYVVKIKWDAITTLNVANLLHWSIIIFQYNPWAQRCVCSTLLHEGSYCTTRHLCGPLKEHFIDHFFCSNEDEEVAVHAGFRMQELDFYCGGICKFVPRRARCTDAFWG